MNIPIVFAMGKTTKNTVKKLHEARRIILNCSNGIHVNRVHIIHCEGYGMDTTPRLGIYTSSNQIQLSIFAEKNTRGSVSYTDMHIVIAGDVNKISLPYGCSSIARVQRIITSFFKNYKI